MFRFSAFQSSRFKIAPTGRCKMTQPSCLLCYETNLKNNMTQVFAYSFWFLIVPISTLLLFLFIVHITGYMLG